ncbi:hypothetical protein T4D_16216 [Trichinella pseudospiralis]|uniref:Uncharacterized protein n=1 Tax=Trichinella pseudospiralis TaxID=6337 RepID=A0A0V1DMP5_TRIPS|nr:hypothetical protein T4D_16216 [Trichinella pseudospiralis]
MSCTNDYCSSVINQRNPIFESLNFEDAEKRKQHWASLYFRIHM